MYDKHHQTEHCTLSIHRVGASVTYSEYSYQTKEKNLENQEESSAKKIEKHKKATTRWCRSLK